MLALEQHGPFPQHPYPAQLPGTFGPFPAAGKPWWCRRVFRLPSGMLAIREGWCHPIGILGVFDKPLR